MEIILQEPIATYLIQKERAFSGNRLAEKLRREFPELLKQILPDQNRYKVVGSPGKGRWTDCPWIAILDSLITTTPQSGYYPVYLFKADMSGVYLSLNQGVTEVREGYKRDAQKVLKLRAEDFRAKIDIEKEDLYEINLASSGNNAKLYEAGNIVARYYPSTSLPDSLEITKDILKYLSLYKDLAYNDTKIYDETSITAIEKKQARLHSRIERNSGISKMVKQQKGYKCEACGFCFTEMYGDIGKEFIEAHHLIPISKLDIGEYSINLETDFAVLCSNCHSMIHKLSDVSNIGKLKEIIIANKSKN